MQSICVLSAHLVRRISVFKQHLLVPSAPSSPLIIHNMSASSTSTAAAAAAAAPAAADVPVPDPSVDGKEALQLYSWPTPNGHKITIFLEEAGIPYDYHAINISKNVQFGNCAACLVLSRLSQV